jgi:hypothetical protein
MNIGKCPGCSHVASIGAFCDHSTADMFDYEMFTCPKCERRSIDLLFTTCITDADVSAHEQARLKDGLASRCSETESLAL